MSKILEKIVIEQINYFSDSENIIPKLQSGFRKGHSTCTALTNIFEDLFRAKDEGKYSSIVLLDYSQAFDSLNHEMLLAKMNYYGFGEDVSKWIKSYLEERLQVTRLGNGMSDPLLKLRGVPQGSCLGPILFNLYTADLPSCLQNCTAHLYADDCQLHLSYDPSTIKDAMNQLNSDLKRISEWSLINGLKLNISKCSVLHIGPDTLPQLFVDSDVSVELSSERLAVCDTVKTLGVVLGKDLSFSDHVTYATQKALGRLKGLSRFRSLLPETAKLKIVQSMVLSVFNYCYPAYGNSISKEDIGRIQKLQNSAIRFIFNLGRFDRVSAFREALNILPMNAVCSLMTCCMIHKTLAVKEPQYLVERLPCRSEIAERSTRQDQKLHFPKVRLEVGRRGFAYFGPALYNGLPDDLKCVRSTNSFKIKLKDILLAHNRL